MVETKINLKSKTDKEDLALASDIQHLMYLKGCWDKLYEFHKSLGYDSIQHTHFSDIRHYIADEYHRCVVKYCTEEYVENNAVSMTELEDMCE